MKSKNSGIRLGVNVDHIATLRQVRGGSTSYPNLLYFVNESILGGAEQITIHLREDRRHIQLQDLKLLSQKCGVDLNLEMAATPEMLRLALKYKPEWVCLVPEKRQELTTEGGLAVVSHQGRIKKMIQEMKRRNIKVSLFVDADPAQVSAAQFCGADAVELHTGSWVSKKGSGKIREWKKLVTAAKLSQSLGLRVHAGHGLDYDHTQTILNLPFLLEVNIGHFLVCEALKDGLKSSVQKMKSILRHRERIP